MELPGFESVEGLLRLRFALVAAIEHRREQGHDVEKHHCVGHNAAESANFGLEHVAAPVDDAYRLTVHVLVH